MVNQPMAHEEERLKAEAIAARFIFEHSYQPPPSCVHRLGAWQSWSALEGCEDVPGVWRDCGECGLIEGLVA
jgi:hypothetical protein